MRLGAVVLGLIVVCAAGAPGVAHAQQPKTTLKLATQAPKQSYTGQLLEKAAKEISASTDGRVELKLYFDSAQGFEQDLIRRMEQGYLDGALLSGVGLAMIDLEMEVLSLPRMATNDAEWAAVVGAVKPALVNAAAKRGFALVELVSIGSVQLAGAGDLATLAAWQQRSVAVSQVPYLDFFAQLGVPVQLLPVAQLLPALQTGQADAVPASPMQMVALQLRTRVKRLSDVSLGRQAGGLVFREKSLAALRPADRAIVERVLGAAVTKLEAASAKIDALATKAMLEGGVTLDQSDAKLEAALDVAAEATYRAFAGQWISLPVINAALAARQHARGVSTISITKPGVHSPVTQAAIAAKSATPTMPRGQPEATNVVLSAALAAAPDHLRALWLAFDECDASMLSLFVQFPLAIAGTRYPSAKALAKACKAGAVAWPSPSALEAALPGLQVGDRGATLVVGKRMLRLEWQAQSWMLAGAE